jgi:large conductance mechanosensitive channel
MADKKLPPRSLTAKTRTATARQRAAAARAKVKERGSTHASGFMSFIREQGVVGLAVGLVLGGAVAVVARSLIDNVVMPPLGFLLGSAEGLKGLTWTVGRTGGKEAVVSYGVFLNDIVNFLVIALVIYLVIHILGFDKKLDKKKDA